VDSRQAAANYGTANSLVVDAAPGTMQSYLRFDVTGITGAVQRVTLRLYAFGSTDNGPVIHSTANGWAETGITWNNKPAPAVSGEDKGEIPRNTWAEYDLTPFVNGDGTYSFVLTPTANNGVDFRSREHSLAPQLVVTFAS
jgi:hypothetical protein